MKLSTDIKRRAGLALARRFGASVMPYEFHEMPYGDWRCTDPETGSWITFRVRHGRIRVRVEHDAEA